MPDDARPPAPTPAAPPDPWRDRLALLLESTGEGIFGIDLEGRCIFVNRAAARMVGYAPQEVLGLNMHALIHHTHADGRDYPEAECPIFLAFREGQACRIDSEVLWRRDGSSFAAEYSSYPILDAGEVRGAVVTFVDISTRRAAEAAMQRSRAELEQRVAERTAELSGALNQLRELSAHLAAVREDERTRIAREIHDELGSLLVALKMDVGWLGKRLVAAPELACKCHAMGRMIDTAVDNVGRIITDLRPSILDHQGLWAALEWHAQEFAETSRLDVSQRRQVDNEAPEPTGDRAIAVFRIFQEMLSNVARHAGARSVAITLRADRSGLRLDVADDGRGAEAQALASPRAYGVLGMRERAQHFGGDVTIAPRPGGGTLARLELPLGEPCR